MPNAVPTATRGRSPTLAANRRRNDEASWWRTPRWRDSRRQLWNLLDRRVAHGARVAVVGAGNGHDLPVRRLASRAAELWLFDLDSAALHRAKQRVRSSRGRVIAHELDITLGGADAIVTAAVEQREPSAGDAIVPLPGAPFDVVIADLLYTQLLYPALADSGLPTAAIDECLTRHGQRLTEQVVDSLHASAPRGIVVHVHDLLGRWRGHRQPVSLTDVLTASRSDPNAALELASQGNQPRGCDPRSAVTSRGAEILETSMWVWPFAPAVEYLVCATVAASADPTGES